MDSRPTNRASTKSIKRKRKDPRKVDPGNQKQRCHWKIGTVNVLTGSDDLLLHECLRQCTRANLDVCCFQEFRRLGQDSITVPITLDDTTHVWNIWWSGFK